VCGGSSCLSTAAQRVGPGGGALQGPATRTVRRLVWPGSCDHHNLDTALQLRAVASVIAFAKISVQNLT